MPGTEWGDQDTQEPRLGPLAPGPAGHNCRLSNGQRLGIEEIRIGRSLPADAHHPGDARHRGADAGQLALLPSAVAVRDTRLKPSMIHRENQGPQAWTGVHVTHRTTVAEIINVDNVGPDGDVLTGFDMFRYAGESVDALIRRGPRRRQAHAPDRRGLGAVEDQHHRRLAGEHQAAERLLRHRRAVLR